MEVDDSTKDGAENLQTEPGLADLTGMLDNVQSVLKNINQKRHSVEAGALEQVKKLKADLGEEKDRHTSSRIHLRSVIIDLQKERNAALEDKKRELQCMQKKLEEELQSMQKKLEEDRERRDRASEEEALAHASVLAQTQAQKLVLEGELDSMRKGTKSWETALETTHRSLHEVREEKAKLELVHDEELKQAELHCQEFKRKAAALSIQKGKVERELVKMQEDHKGLKISLDTVQKNLVDEKDTRLKSEGELVTTREDRDRLKIALDATQNHLEEEKEKQLCKICLQSRKDVICLPCVHADYCFVCLEKHRKKSRTCPTCRTALSGVLKSDIGS